MCSGTPKNVRKLGIVLTYDRSTTTPVISPVRRRGQKMARKYFGTDGIRGRANGVITPELALRVGQAAGLAFRRGEHRHRVLIGKDTRLSGYMIETALVAGFTSVGIDVLLTGPIPTPAAGVLTRSRRAHLRA